MKYLFIIAVFINLVSFAQPVEKKVLIVPLAVNASLEQGSSGQFLKHDFTWGTPVGGAGEAFPVGSVFLSVVSTNPSTLLGYGTWTAIAAGQMLVGFNASDPNFDAAEETGGSKTSTIGAANLPQLSVSINDPGHTHLTQRYPTATGALSGFTIDASMSGTLADNTLPVKSATTGITATANTGGGQIIRLVF